MCSKYAYLVNYMIIIMDKRLACRFLLDVPTSKNAYIITYEKCLIT